MRLVMTAKDTRSTRDALSKGAGCTSSDVDDDLWNVGASLEALAPRSVAGDGMWSHHYYGSSARLRRHVKPPRGIGGKGSVQQ